jgi:histone H3/H4
MESEESCWRRCSTCKKPIDFGKSYYVCSVSTCNGQRTGYVFCSVPCFERHLPGARHKDAAAIEKSAPRNASEPAAAPNRILIKTPGSSSNKVAIPREVLVIASRLKEYVQARADYNTSGGVMDVLSDYLRILCDRAIDNARAEGRKTVMERDFEFLKKS